MGAWCCDLFYTLILATLGSLLIELPVQSMWRTRVEGAIMHWLKEWVKRTKGKGGKKKGKGSRDSRGVRESGGDGKEEKEKEGKGGDVVVEFDAKKGDQGEDLTLGKKGKGDI